MRVGVIALLQESNTFLGARTTLAHFEQELLLTGEPMRQRLAGAHHEVGGFFAGLDAEKLDAVPIFAARALPFGTIEAEAFTELLNRLDAALDQAGPLDGLLVAPHGATVAESAPDADGHWLTRVRQRVGPRVPIIGTLDLHANLSPAMVAATNALLAYRTNPHLDQRERGLEAARLLARTLRGEVRPVQAAAYPPLVASIDRQATAEEPARSLFARADDWRQRSGVLGVSALLGFPYADVAEMGVSVIVVADGDAGLARQGADDLAEWWWSHREQFASGLEDAASAVARAKGLPGPVLLLDMGDNVGGGSPGDGTVLALELHRQGVGPAVVCLCDPAAQEQARAAGVGARLPLSVGGRGDPGQPTPLTAEFTVRGLFDGQFSEPEARHGGITSFDQGPTAVVETDGGLTVLLTTRRMVPFSLRQLTSCEIDPGRFQVLVAKGVVAPLAAYAPVSRSVVRVDTPGVTTADVRRLAYRHRRRPMFPFEEAAMLPAGGPFHGL